MKQFYSPNELDYSPLIEFLNELDDAFDDDPLYKSPTRFGFRFEQASNKTNVEIIQYGKYRSLYSITLTLDGDDDLINSFLRAFDSFIIRYTPLNDVRDKIKDLSIEEIAFKYNDIYNDACKFQKHLFGLFVRANNLYKERKAYYDHLNNNAQLRMRGFN